MATNLALDDRLIEQAVRLGKHRTKRDAVTAALREYVAQRRRLAILDWTGKVEYWDDYEHKRQRKRRSKR